MRFAQKMLTQHNKITFWRPWHNVYERPAISKQKQARIVILRFILILCK